MASTSKLLLRHHLLLLLLLPLLLFIIVEGKEQRCGLWSVELVITNTGKLVGYDPVFEVEVRNRCRCAVAGVFLSSEGFSSSMMVDPELFRREGDEYLVNGGRAIPSSHSVKFDYSWDRAFKMAPVGMQASC